MANKNNYRQWIMLALLLVLTGLPLFVFAAGEISEKLVPCGQTVGLEGGDPALQHPCGYQDFLMLLKKVFDYLVKFAVPLAAGVIVIGGAKMMLAGTNDSDRSQAKKNIWMAVWGLVIVLASYLIVKLVFTTLVKLDSPYFPSNFKN